MWVFRDQYQKVHIVIADSKIPLQEQAKALFSKEYYTQIEKHMSEVENRKIPKNVKKMFGSMSKDDIEWALAMEFEPDYDYPEIVKLTHGNSDSVPAWKLGESELDAHSHPGDEGILALPSPQDLSLTNFKRPELVVWTNPKTGRDVWVYVTSNLDPYKNESERLERKASVENAWKRSRKEATEKAGYSAKGTDAFTGEKDVDIEDTQTFRDILIEHLNEIGYNIQIINPEITDVIAGRGHKTHQNKSSKPEYNPKAVRNILAQCKDMNTNWDKANALLRIYNYAQQTGNKYLESVVTGENGKMDLYNENSPDIQQPAHVLETRLIKVKCYLDQNKKVRQLTRESIGIIPFGDSMNIDIHNLKNMKKRVQKARNKENFNSPKTIFNAPEIRINPDEAKKAVSAPGYSVEGIQVIDKGDNLNVNVRARKSEEGETSIQPKGIEYDLGDNEIAYAYNKKKKKWRPLAKKTQLEKPLTRKERNRLPDSDFAIPELRKYPIENPAHARNALARVAQFGTQEEKQRVREAVHKRYPKIS